MRYGAYSSSEVKSSSDDEVKEKSYSSSSCSIAGIDGLGGGCVGGMPSSCLSAVRFSLIVISLAYESNINTIGSRILWKSLKTGL